MKRYKYIHEMLNRRSFYDFLTAMNGKVDLKEWSECYAMYQIIKQEKDVDIVFDIGCGKRPTLATIVALNLKSVKRVICIDPNLDLSTANNINNMSKFNYSLNDYLNEFIQSASYIDSKCIIACNHSHVSMKEIYRLTDLIKDWIYITCPCCIDNKMSRGEYIRDTHIWSPKNEIYIYRKANKS